MTEILHRPRRSVLYVPASNDRALAKIASLACDAVIVDLEDAVAPADKVSAREKLAKIFAGGPARRCEMVVRINALSSQWGADDLLAAAACEPDGILLPKVDTPRDVLEAGDVLDDAFVPETTGLWAMIETPRALLNIGAIAELGRDPASRLACFVAGTNDLLLETGVPPTPDRRYLTPWLMQMVLAARAGGLDVVDGVCNDFRDLDGFAEECSQAAAMGFDGKTLIHPAQIELANQAFSPSAEALGQARAVTEAFALPENAKNGVIALEGRMVERLHLAQAEKLLAKAAAIGMIAGGRPFTTRIEMKLYRFLTAPDDASFCHKVTAALNKGWHLFGSPTYAYDRQAKAMRCGQAVVKDVDGQEYVSGETKLSDW